MAFGVQSVNIGIVTLFLLTSFSARADDSWVRPHIKTFTGAPAEVAAPYLDDVEHCLVWVERAIRKSGDQSYVLKIEKLELSTAFPIAGGSAGDIELSLSGPPDRATACHEVFHVFEIQGWFKKTFATKRTAENKTSPLHEAAPQILAVLGTKDCLVGREGRKEMAYDHCQKLSWEQLPSLRETATKEKSLAQKYGVDPAYWDHILKLDEVTLGRPSAYYSSIPLGYAIFESFTDCDPLDLTVAFLETMREESHTKTPNFESIRTITPYFFQRIEKYSSSSCANRFRELATSVGLMP